MRDWERNALPTLNSSQDDVKTYIQRVVNPLSPRRRWITQRAAINAWMYHGRQWIESVGGLAAASGTYSFFVSRATSLSTAGAMMLVTGRLYAARLDLWTSRKW